MTRRSAGAAFERHPDVDGKGQKQDRDQAQGLVPVLVRGNEKVYVTLCQARGGLRNPGTVIFADYGSSSDDSGPFAFRELTRTSDGFFVKLSYLFRL